MSDVAPTTQPELTVELRVLTGLHRGAVLPLDSGETHIGSTEDNDVVLLDPGIEPEHAAIRYDDESGQWLLSYAQDGTPIRLQIGQRVQIGEVWMSLAYEGSPWQELSPEANAPEPAEEPRRPAWLATVLVMITVCLLLGAVGLWWQIAHNKPSSPKPTAVPQTQMQTFPITPVPPTLPFKLTRIQAGPDGFVITDSNLRINIGDSYQGYTLLDVQPHTVIFGGKQPVEVAW